MKLRNLKYFLVEALSGMFKNRLMSLASIITVVSCTLLLSISYFVISNLDYMLESVERSMIIIAYIDDEVSDAGVLELEQLILDIEYVDGISFTSSEEALRMFSEGLADQETFLQGLGDTNVLPRSFDIEVNDIEAQDDVVEKLLALENEGIYGVLHDPDTIEVLASFNRSVRLASSAMIVFLGGVSTIIIMNTIKITVSTRKVEINIMKYVGATDWFIRWPFILEGVLIGLIAAIISLIISWLTYLRTIEIIVTNIPFITNMFGFRDAYSIFTVLIPTTLVMGVSIGVVGSVTSIRKHLRV